MGDLADEIEQMQAEINAFDDKLDQIDGWVNLTIHRGIFLKESKKQFT